MHDNLIPVGLYLEEYNAKTGQTLPCGLIYKSNGFSRHVWKHHPEEAAELLDCFQDVVNKPDFVGQHPREANSIELVKIMNDSKNILIGIKQHKNDYLYVSTIHSISKEKLENRLRIGRLHKLSSLQLCLDV